MILLGMLLVFALLCLWVCLPLWKSGLDTDGATGTAWDEFLFTKEAALDALLDLDFDYYTGKISASDYKILRDRYQAQAIDLMKQEDAIEASYERFQRLRAEGRLS